MANITKIKQVQKKNIEAEVAHIFESVGYIIYRIKSTRSADYILYNTINREYENLSIEKCADALMNYYYQSNRKFIINDIIPDIEIKDFNVAIKELKQLIVLNAIPIDGINYKPSVENIFFEDGKYYFNSYRKSIFLENIEANFDFKEYSFQDFENIHALGLNLCGGILEQLEYFYKVLAFCLQNPLQKVPSSIIFKGEEGTGKTLFVNSVFKRIWGDNHTIVSQAQLESDKNGYMYGKQSLVINEPTSNHGRFDIADKLKAPMSDDYIPVRELYKEPKNCKNYMFVLITTNNLCAIPIKQGNRRISIFESFKLRNAVEFVEKYKLNFEKEIISFTNYLLNIDVSYKDISIPYENEIRKRLIGFSQNNMERFLEEFERRKSEVIEEVYKNEAPHDLNMINQIYGENKEEFCFKQREFYDFYNHWCSYNELNKSYDRIKFNKILLEYGYIQKNTTFTSTVNNLTDYKIKGRMYIKQIR